MHMSHNSAARPSHKMLISVLIMMATLIVAGCSPLSIYNTVAPADSGAVLSKSDAAYGTHPRQKLDVYKPEVATAAAPVVVVIYGGAWNSGSKSDYAFLGRALAARGFVAMVIDYRLVPEVRFPAFLEDCAHAVAWANVHAREFGGDPNRLFVIGHSAGAYNAVMVALDGHYLKALGSDPKIIRGVAALAGPYDFLPLDKSSTKEAFGHAENPDQTQPGNFVTAKAPAMLLATGDDDTTVRPRNTLMLAERLRRDGNSVEVKRYPGVGHIDIMLAMSRPLRSRAPVLDDVVQFFNSQP